MKRFECNECSTIVNFDNTECLTCGAHLGFDPDSLSMLCYRDVAPNGFHICANADLGGCNWLVKEGEGDFCKACRLNSIVPDLSNDEFVERWRALEAAKRFFLYGLIRLGLPIVSREEDPEEGLAFELLADDPGSPDGGHVLTGHDNGVITINIAEASSPEREARREALGEPMRTLVGHFRHESGHYYWNRLVRDGGKLEAARAVFGDERDEYSQALERYYADGAPLDWQSNFISAYASSHPWEDFAESWAHYLHMIDGLDTAFDHGVMPAGMQVSFDPYQGEDIEKMTSAWAALSVAVNAINRSIGQPDLYPFVFSASIVQKLGFIQGIIHRTI